MTKIDFTTPKLVICFTLKSLITYAQCEITLIGETRNEILDNLRDILKREYDLELLQDAVIIKEKYINRFGSYE